MTTMTTKDPIFHNKIAKTIRTVINGFILLSQS